MASRTGAALALLAGGLALFAATSCASPVDSLDTAGDDLRGRASRGGPRRRPVTPARDSGPIAAVIGGDGWSDEIEVIVPEGSRSIHVVVDGEPGRLYGVGALVLSDGIDRLGIFRTGISATKILGSDSSLIAFQTYALLGGGALPCSAVFQETSAFTFPQAPEDTMLAGSARLRILSDATGSNITVRAFFAPDDGSHILRVNIQDFSLEVDRPRFEEIFARAAVVMADAGIDLRIDEYVDHGESPFNVYVRDPSVAVTSDDETFDAAVVARAATTSTSLNLYLNDFAYGDGVSLGIPGPFDPENPRYGIVVDRGGMLSDEVNGERVAHELGHFLGLRHARDRLPDPLDPFSDLSVLVDHITDNDAPDTIDLMAGVDPGDRFTPDEARALYFSPMLTNR